MTKLNADLVIEVLRHLVADVEDILDFERGEFNGDLERISKSLRSRGQSVILIDLPDLCSDLEQSLERGVYVNEKSKLFHSNGRPTLFKRIYSRIFKEDYSLLDSACPESIRCLRQIYRLFKKFEIDCPDSATQEKIHEFREIERGLATPNLSWGDDRLLVRGRYPSLVDLGIRHVFDDDVSIGSIASVCRWNEKPELLRDLSFIQLAADRILRSFRYSEAWFRPKHGPGAVSEPYRNSKFEFPTWPERLEAKFPFAEWGIANLSFWDSSSYHGEESPCKLLSVPKDYKGPRLIASEPICSQFIQQGLLSVLRKNVKNSPLRYCIDFKSQEPSRDLALKASVDRDLSTIDLSSASDRLSCAAVECFFRGNFSFLELLNSARTPDILYPDGQIERMKKFAAQGAAFTFPVQSIVYAISCIGVLLADSPQSRLVDLAKKVRVFGDDMIVPTHVFDRVCNALESIGLKVNRSKSFKDGFFRESCGMDAYKGTDVTPASVRCFFSTRQPVTVVSLLECSNNLFHKGFIRASRRLLETIPKGIRKKIPFVRPGSTVNGIVSSTVCGYRYRHNTVLCRDEVQVLEVEIQVRKTLVDGHHRLFQWFIEEPLPDTVWRSGQSIRDVKASYRLRWVPTYRLVG